MKFSRFLAYAFFLFWTFPTLAADCNVQLQQSNKYSDVSAKLKCLQDRINALEAKIDKIPRSTAQPTPADQANKMLQAAPKGRSVNYKGTIIALDKCRMVGWQSNELECKYSITNTANSDKKICFGGSSRLTTDTGVTFSASSNYAIWVGSKSGYASNGVCDLIAPLVSANGGIRFSRAKGKADATVQLVRLDCGGGCTLNAYNVPID